MLCRGMNQWRLLLLSAFLQLSGQVNAGMIQTSNQSPIISLFGLPPPASFQHQLKSAYARVSLANNFIPRSSENESLLLDGETLRLETGLVYPVGDCWDAEVRVPFVKHSGGQLDSFVDSWHDIFGLPESGRPLTPNDRLLYSYRLDGDSVLAFTDSTSGLGDIVVSFAYSPVCDLQKTLLLRSGVKFATGDPDRLMGSGGTDFFVDFSRTGELVDSVLDYSFTTGLLFTESSELFSNQRSSVIYASGGLSWRFNSTVAFGGQLTAHSPFFDSELKVLGQWALQIVVGSWIDLSDQLQLEVAMSEDPVYGSSPDVVFHTGLNFRF